MEKAVNVNFQEFHLKHIKTQLLFNYLLCNFKYIDTASYLRKSGEINILIEV